MRPFCRHSFIINIIIIIVVVIVVVGHLKSFQPQKQRFTLFENNTGRTDTTFYRDAWSHLKTHELEKITSTPAFVSSITVTAPPVRSNEVSGAIIAANNFCANSSSSPVVSCPSWSLSSCSYKSGVFAFFRTRQRKLTVTLQGHT